MKIVLSWLKEFVDIDLTPEELAHKLTFGGLEVEEVEYVGLAPREAAIAGLPPAPRAGERPGLANAPQARGLAWDRARIVVAAILEVMPHPNADRLTLLRLDDGSGREQTVLTGAPNLFAYRGQGPLPQPLKAAYAREGSILYDGHKPGWELMTLKKTRIRGVESYSMVCSEKELGISEEHEGIILLDDDAPVGMPLADYMGDVVFTIKINPNMARNANVYGVAREIAALTGRPLRAPHLEITALGTPIAGQVQIEIRTPELNPRFSAALIRGVQIRPSPYQVQRRLRLCGMRPINNIVDATNYAMLELGQPLHAFDYDTLAQRAGGAAPTIITRLPAPGESLTTLDGVERKLDDYTILVCDTRGALSLGGVMGGAESEVSDRTVNVLLEGAAWQFINIRRTLQSQKLSSEAGYRFSRGVHPGMTVRGVARGIELMRQWAGGTVAQGLVDVYAQPAPVVTVDLPAAEVERLLGVRLSVQEIAGLLERLEFTCQPGTDGLRVSVPDHRMDIGTGVVGQADLVEEVGRLYGFDRIPERQMEDLLPPQRPNRALELEEQARDLLVASGLGLQEIVTYSLTSIERERRLMAGGGAPDERPYVTLVNPIVADRVVMRHSLLSSVLDVVAANLRLRERVAVFEVGPVYLAEEEGLPAEPRRLALALTGPRTPLTWQGSDRALLDFFDLKGALEALLNGLHLEAAAYAPETHPTFMPGRTARLLLEGQPAGWLGELHPLVREQFDLPAQPVLAAELDLELILSRAQERFAVRPVPEYPPVKEDIAVIVAEEVPAARVEAAITTAGGNLLESVVLFDVYRGDQIGAGCKSLAYRLTYQAPDRTLTDSDAAKVRGRIVKKLQDELKATLRG